VHAVDSHLSEPRSEHERAADVGRAVHAELAAELVRADREPVLLGGEAGHVTRLGARQLQPANARDRQSHLGLRVKG